MLVLGIWIVMWASLRGEDWSGAEETGGFCWVDFDWFCLLSALVVFGVLFIREALAPFGGDGLGAGKGNVAGFWRGQNFHCVLEEWDG